MVYYDVSLMPVQNLFHDQQPQTVALFGNVCIAHREHDNHPYEEKAYFCKDQKDFNDNFELSEGYGSVSLHIQLNKCNIKLM